MQLSLHRTEKRFGSRDFWPFLKIKLTLKGTEIGHHRRYAEKVAQDLEVNPKEVLQPQME